MGCAAEDVQHSVMAVDLLCQVFTECLDHLQYVSNLYLVTSLHILVHVLVDCKIHMYACTLQLHKIVEQIIYNRHLWNSHSTD